ncbi:hypothetical protein ACJRO7_013598 [Eucalyptus globulus]|uniref:Uncharacterized protein n=1 Tax=Eucalyptus globulus TaxID=34317 RepID=A0ABD3L3L5_EUCGL
MLRYGDTSSVQWFYIELSCIFHIFKCFRDSYEVVVRRCRSLTLVFPCPDWGMNKFNWFSRGFNSREPVDTNANKHGGYLFTCAYCLWVEIEHGIWEIQESNFMGTEFSMDFPFINAEFTGLRNRYGYAQVTNSEQALIAVMQCQSPLSSPCPLAQSSA